VPALLACPASSITSAFLGPEKQSYASLRLYPMEDAVETAIEEVSLAQPQVKGKKPSDFVDASILKKMESEGFFTRLHR
jgi:hypothetical protein